MYKYLTPWRVICTRNATWEVRLYDGSMNPVICNGTIPQDEAGQNEFNTALGSVFGASTGDEIKQTMKKWTGEIWTGEI